MNCGQMSFFVNMVEVSVYFNKKTLLVRVAQPPALSFKVFVSRIILLYRVYYYDCQAGWWSDQLYLSYWRINLMNLECIYALG